MNVEKNIRGRQRVLVTVWIWHIVLILYILFIYSNSMRPAVQSSADSGRILRFLQKLAAESRSRLYHGCTETCCAQMCSFY